MIYFTFLVSCQGFQVVDFREQVIHLFLLWFILTLSSAFVDFKTWLLSMLFSVSFPNSSTSFWSDLCSALSRSISDDKSRWLSILFFSLHLMSLIVICRWIVGANILHIDEAHNILMMIWYGCLGRCQWQKFFQSQIMDVANSWAMPHFTKLRSFFLSYYFTMLWMILIISALRTFVHPCKSLWCCF